MGHLSLLRSRRRFAEKLRRAGVLDLFLTPRGPSPIIPNYQNPTPLEKEEVFHPLLRGLTCIPKWDAVSNRQHPLPVGHMPSIAPPWPRR